MKDGEFVLVDFIGKVKESEEIFDLTREEVAKEKNIYNPEIIYKPIPVIIGSHYIIKGIEEELKKMNVGERKTTTIKIEDVFGQRSDKLIKLIPINEFKKQNIDPYPGMPINMNNLRGRVITISGGRVKVDFNHPLAGKELEYDLEIKSEIKNDDEKVKAIVELFVKPKDKIDVYVKNGVADIIMGETIPRETKKDISDLAKNWIKDVKKARFIEEFDFSVEDKKQPE